MPFPPETNPPPEPDPGPAADPELTHLQRWWPAIAGALMGVGLRLVFSGKPGAAMNAMDGSFVVFVPLVVGAVAVVVAENTARRSSWRHFGIAAWANALFVFATLLATIEGLICVILAVPLFAVLGGFAGVITGALCRWARWPRRSVYGFALLPLMLGAFEYRLPLPQTIETITHSRLVEASPEEIWAVLLSPEAIRPEEMEDGWMYRIGVPLPLSAVTQEQGGALVRHVTMGKQIHFDQVATDWSASRRVAWTYRFAEDSFPPGALDDHVRIGGRYFDLIETVYTLEPHTQGTMLSVEMRYRVSTNFNWYVRPVAKLLVGNFGETALGFYAGRAEGTSKQTP